jgi:hypothetical protein
VKIEQVLKDLSFPVEKKITLAHMQDLQITNPKANQILPLLPKIIHLNPLLFVTRKKVSTLMLIEYSTMFANLKSP